VQHSLVIYELERKWKQLSCTVGGTSKWHCSAETVQTHKTAVRNTCPAIIFVPSVIFISTLE